MFKRDNGYFSKIECPEFRKFGHCKIINCIFNHQNHIGSTNGNGNGNNVNNGKRKSLSQYEGDSKKQKVENREADLSPILSNHLNIDIETRTANIEKLKKFMEKNNDYNQSTHINERELRFLETSKSIEEYQHKINKFVDSSSQLKDPKFILPQEIKLNAPASIATRKLFIQKLVDVIKKNNPEIHIPILTAIEEEYKVASTTSTSTYDTSIKKVIFKYMHPEKVKKPVEITQEDFKNALNKTIISEDKLKDHGYVMEIPEDTNPSVRRKCHRCQAEFNRTEMLEPTQCIYHSGKIRKKDRFIKYYDCCMKIADDAESEPCSKSNHHVFYWNNPEEMNWARPFKRTTELFPSDETHKKSFALGIDCEMGYTTKGFELLRVTALDFFTGEEVLDILTQVDGEVIDLNTKWSGVEAIPPDALDFNDMLIKLGEIMDKDTILIGHGLENDMNALRLIHNKVIDTAILYPRHSNTKRFKYSLKDLAFKYLSRNIQIGEHDSGEDSLAAIDIVKYFVHLDFKKQNPHHK
ncbi:uncharacterized protein RJT21DRAFT_119371 [Scheffersomyces amazonensis]|uniref:uncharacterized protein n=1 Tax=Scheffersomyces amazonensis TaxID=1078765 RepID=UPI00315DD50A